MLKVISTKFSYRYPDEYIGLPVDAGKDCQTLLLASSEHHVFLLYSGHVVAISKVSHKEVWKYALNLVDIVLVLNKFGHI